MGRRATKKVTVNGSVTLHQRFLYRGYLQIACCDLTRSNHPCLWLLTWDPSQPVTTRPLAIQKNGTWYTYGWDLTKNICEVYGQHGYVRTAYSYTPYGEVTSDGDTEQPIQWSSEYYDLELKLVYYNWRYYNPNSGRWFSRDPIGELGSRSLFAYAHNNPAMYTDERGLKVSISADKNRCAIIVNYDIVIYSSPTHPVEQQKLEMLKQTIKNAIESRWNGLKKGCCIVEFKVDVSVAVDKPCWVCRWFSDSNYIEITNEDKFRSYVSGGKGGKWWADANPWVFAHEAGHLAGLPDDYKDVKYKDPNTGEEITQSRANEGHEGHMMATSGGKVVQHEVEDIVKNVACPCDNQ